MPTKTAWVHLTSLGRANIPIGISYDMNKLFEVHSFKYRPENVKKVADRGISKNKLNQRIGVAITSAHLNWLNEPRAGFVAGCCWAVKDSSA